MLSDFLFTRFWVRCWGRILDRPGTPKRILSVCWECLAETLVQEIFNSHCRKKFNREGGRLRTLSQNGQCFAPPYLRLSTYLLIYVPTQTYGHMLWVVIERTRLRIQAAEKFLHLRLAGFWLAQSRAAARPSQKEPVEVGTSQVRFSRHVPPGGGPRDPGHTGWMDGIIVCLY